MNSAEGHRLLRDVLTVMFIVLLFPLALLTFCILGEIGLIFSYCNVDFAELKAAFLMCSAISGEAVCFILYRKVTTFYFLQKDFHHSA